MLCVKFKKGNMIIFSHKLIFLLALYFFELTDGPVDEKCLRSVCLHQCTTLSVNQCMNLHIAATFLFLLVWPKHYGRFFNTSLNTFIRPWMFFWPRHVGFSRLFTKTVDSQLWTNSIVTPFQLIKHFIIKPAHMEEAALRCLLLRSHKTRRKKVQSLTLAYKIWATLYCARQRRP